MHLNWQRGGWRARQRSNQCLYSYTVATLAADEDLSEHARIKIQEAVIHQDLTATIVGDCNTCGEHFKTDVKPTASLKRAADGLRRRLQEHWKHEHSSRRI